MSQQKQLVRKQFRDAVLKRDGYKCKICRHDVVDELDAHHITDRNEMPNGGYVLENGITLCKLNCHEMVEEFHVAGQGYPGFMPDDLYKLIGSSKEKAIEASNAPVV